jgi:hypothetical protein
MDGLRNVSQNVTPRAHRSVGLATWGTCSLEVVKEDEEKEEEKEKEEDL